VGIQYVFSVSNKRGDLQMISMSEHSHCILEEEAKPATDLFYKMSMGHTDSRGFNHIQIDSNFDSATWYSTHKCSTQLRFNCENSVCI
jgi:hypothetical protein